MSRRRIKTGCCTADHRYNSLVNAAEQTTQSYHSIASMIKTAELMVMEQLIAQINQEAAHYSLAVLRRNKPCKVKLCLESARECEDGSLPTSLKVRMYYKDVDHSPIDSLSGGERQKLDAAFLLAVSNIMGSKMILLDECFSELGKSLCTPMLTFIRDELAANKLIMVVCKTVDRSIFK